MYIRKLFNFAIMAIFVGTTLFGGSAPAIAQSAQPSSATAPAVQAQSPLVNDEIGQSNPQSAMSQMRGTTAAMREAAASRLTQSKKAVTLNFAGINPAKAAMSILGNVASSIGNAASSVAAMLAPLATPDYFAVPNWANSPWPTINTTTGAVTGGMHKFINGLPGLTSAGANNLGQYIPLGVPDTTTFTGTDYYEIALVEYHEQMHGDLPVAGTQLRGYVQIETSVVHPAGGTHTIPLRYPDGTAVLDGAGAQVYAVDKPSYLGPTLLATKGRAVRVKFTNYLPTTNKGGNLFIPTDTTYMGAGMGPGGSVYSVSMSTGGAGYVSSNVAFGVPPTGGTRATGFANIIGGIVVSVTVTNGGSGYTTAPSVTFVGAHTSAALATSVLTGQPGWVYSQNRATLHLHGGNTPWISDGTPHQWTTPRGELNTYMKGDSVAYVPDMWFDGNGNLIPACAGNPAPCPGGTNDPGLGSLSFYWTNNESGRLMFYHDHAYGITRLNVYAGEAAGYLLSDPAEEAALLAATVPGTITGTPDLAHLIPLVIQDKTFVPDNGLAGGQLAATDPTWDVTQFGGFGNLWFPHVYMPNQNPYDDSGANPYGRWDYGPWFWPAQAPGSLTYPPVSCTSTAYPGATLTCPGIPNPSGTPESFMDTPVINGTAYPTTTVDPTAYRLQMLMAGNDRTWNLGFYVADPLTVAVTNGGTGYTAAPTVAFVGGAGGAGATATAVVSGGLVSGATFTNVGAGYTVAPLVTISGDGTGALATSALAGSSLGAITITAGGTGYTYATIAIAAPGCTPAPTTCVQATATATIAPSGSVVGIIVTNPGTTPWTAVPTVTFTGAGAGATAIASINTEVKMVVAAPHSAISTPPLCTSTNPTGGAMLVGALLDASGNPLNGTGLQANCWPTSWPTDGRDGGVPDPATAGPPIIQIGTEGGVLPAPAVIPSTPVGYEYNRRSITVLNIFQHGLTLGPAERADVVVDFSQFAGKTLILYNDAPAPVPAFDARSDYYTGDPDQTSSGGAPETLPGYGPNTRTIMQVVVRATAAGALPTTPFSLSALSTALPVIFSTTQDPIIVPEKAYPAANGGSTVNTYARIQDTSTNFFTGALSSLTLTNAGVGYGTAPAVTISAPGCVLGPTCVQATATASVSASYVASLTLVSGGTGYGTDSPYPLVFTSGGGTGAAGTATTNTSGVITSVTLTNRGTGYTSPPTITVLPHTGTSFAVIRATIVTGVVTSLTLTNPGKGYFAMPTVTLAAPPCTLGPTCVQATATAVGTKYGFEPKAIQELFTNDYGRMNATLGVELPFTNFLIQTTIPMGYVDPATELATDGQVQIWKITHNGVDTHFIHFHLFTVQVINRVGWDGAIKPPDANELSWKDTVRMNPLEDIIVALKPMKQTLPWQLPNSIRPLDVTQTIGATTGFTGIDPINEPAAVTNQMVNFGQEYVWHCHILGHEENDMMRAISLVVAPAQPGKPTLVQPAGLHQIQLTWADNALNETGYTVQRATSPSGPWNVIGTTPAKPGTGSVTFTSTTFAIRTTYFYRVVANNMVGYTQTYAAPTVGYPHFSVDSLPSLASNITTGTAAPNAYIMANGFEAGLADWAALVGGVQAIAQAAIGPDAGALGLAATIGAGAQTDLAPADVNPAPAYVSDNTPNDESVYDAGFYFQPNDATSGSVPVDIFVGLDQTSNPLFGVQYQHTADEASYLVRGWSMVNGKQVFTTWSAITNEPHQLEAAWTAAASGGFSLYVDSALSGSLAGDTSAATLYQVNLGPSNGLTPGAAGTMYFDSFTSNRVPGLQYNVYMPALSH